MSKSTRVRSIGLTFLMVVVWLLPGTAAMADRGNIATYSVRLDNLTHTQPFSPPVFVTHAPAYRLFQVGTLASEGIQLIAETGNNSVATADAQASNRTFEVVAHNALVMPGESLTVHIRGPQAARLSLAAMLGITNDGFTGADRFPLPNHGSIAFNLVGLDAGTEANNELAEYVGALGGQLRAPTYESIAYHPGILGVGDMDPVLYGWQDPVARLTITRID